MKVEERRKAKLGPYAKLRMASALISVALSRESVKGQKHKANVISESPQFKFLRYPQVSILQPSVMEKKIAGEAGHGLPEPKLEP